jgi:hypothetical protein
LELVDTRARVTIERTILGSIQVSQDEVRTDPIPIRISDSILDATSPEREAVGAPTWPLAHAVLTIRRTTVFGEIQAHAIELAEDSIFVGRIRVARRQLGCMRFCSITPGSRTPRRYRCQPDLAEEAARAALPGTDVRPDASVRIILADGADDSTASCRPADGQANLELALEVDEPAADVGDEFGFSVIVRNHGPRDASGIEVLLTGPSECLEPVSDEPVVTQGSYDDRDDGMVWTVGDLAAGQSASFSLRLTLEEACDPPVISTVITTFALEGDGRAFTDARLAEARRRVQPAFDSTRYGAPTYAQLAPWCPPEISRGASDESEMGAFHDLFQPQRTANLEARLDEFVPAGMDAAIIHAS